MKPLISLCMIVKNEERVLNRCLNSVKGIIDEIIIVDTGSTDRTKEIALQYTNLVYFFAWNNNFSDARNYAASKANGEWILVLDADEYVERENLVEAIKELEDFSDGIEVFLNKFINFTGEHGEGTAQHTHSRIYRNNGTIEYHRAIHEQLHKKDNSIAQTKFSCLVIYHSGYLNETVKEKKKLERNSVLIGKELKKKTDSDFDYFNVGNELKIDGKINEALEAYIKAYKLSGGKVKLWKPMCVNNIAECLIDLKKYNQALLYIVDVQKVFPKSADFAFLKGYIYFLQKRFGKAKESFLQILNHQHLYTEVIKSPETKEYLPNKFLGALYEKEKNYKQALIHSIQAINKHKYCFDSVLRVIRILRFDHTDDEVFQFVSSKILSSSTEEFKVNIISFVLNQGFTDLANLITKEYFGGNALIEYLVAVKIHIINGTKEIDEIEQSLQINTIISGIKTSIIDKYDLFILFHQIENHKTKDQLQQLLINSNLHFLLGNQSEGSIHIDNAEENIFLHLLEKSLVFKKFDLIDYFIEINESLDVDLNSKIAGIFYSQGYEDIAIEFYQKSGPNTLTEDSYIQIIEWLISKKEIQEAKRIAKEAIRLFENNDCFHDYLKSVPLK